MTLSVAKQNDILKMTQDAVREEIKKRRAELLSDPKIMAFLPKNVIPSRGWLLRRESTDWIDIISAKAMGPLGQALYEGTLPQNIAALEQAGALTAVQELTFLAYKTAMAKAGIVSPDTAEAGNGNFLELLRQQAAERRGQKTHGAQTAISLK